MDIINFSDEYFMKLALKEAQAAFDREEVPVGAVIISNQRVIAKAHNLTETLMDVTAHAEILAVTAATQLLGGKYLNNCTLYVTLEPCPMCAGALNWSQIGRVVYGADDEKRGCMKHEPSIFHPKTEITGGILKEDCSELIKQFFRIKR